jgi:hypothetical protein
MPGVSKGCGNIAYHITNLAKLSIPISYVIALVTQLTSIVKLTTCHTATIGYD